jgi:protein-tyrosine-phosphatase
MARARTHGLSGRGLTGRSIRLIGIAYWPILDPTGLGETREAKLAAYRQARDQIRERMLARFGPPTKG